MTKDQDRRRSQIGILTFLQHFKAAPDQINLFFHAKFDSTGLVTEIEPYDKNAAVFKVVRVFIQQLTDLALRHVVHRLSEEDDVKLAGGCVA